MAEFVKMEREGVTPSKPQEPQSEKKTQPQAHEKVIEAGPDKNKDLNTVGHIITISPPPRVPSA